MATDGSPIDISILEALIELRKQQAQVDQFCQRAEERKDKVEAAVFSRVMADYGKRRADLEAQAAPLVTRALVGYRELRASFDAVRATQAAARLDKEEIEFRHALGEVDDPVKADRLKEPERLIAETTEQLLGLDKQEALFAQALPGVDSGSGPSGRARTAAAGTAGAGARAPGGVGQQGRGDIGQPPRRLRHVQGRERCRQGGERPPHRRPGRSRHQRHGPGRDCGPADGRGRRVRRLRPDDARERRSGLGRLRLAAGRRRPRLGAAVELGPGPRRQAAHAAAHAGPAVRRRRRRGLHLHRPRGAPAQRGRQRPGRQLPADRADLHRPLRGQPAAAARPRRLAPPRPRDGHPGRLHDPRSRSRRTAPTSTAPASTRARSPMAIASPSARSTSSSVGAPAAVSA